uniref:BY PROTMAP: gi/472582198/gb/EMS19894.1/ alpha-1,2-mannosyltransferase (Ktr4), glycosyltransferase family 15 protein [Rhodosporidium toruloides NP11] gi/647399699/emb/CDR44625.1/ RHTO0S09e07096g1_1... n=1 Tax=Rhodotorula toruloides TaxID=5286 RepID=A0A0K3CLW7_RHOTO
MLPRHSTSPVRLKGHPDLREDLPLLARIAPFLACVLLAVLVLTSLNPSPWSSPTHLFLRRPPPLIEADDHVPPVSGCSDTSLTALEGRENAAIVLLIRESDLPELLPTLSSFESRFNARFRYPYVFVSDPDDPPLPDEFKLEVGKVLPEGAVTEWGVVPEAHWRIPEWMDQTEVRAGFILQEERGVQYAGREGYHHMCRWYSGLWARHPLLAKYDWYWRLEPGVRFYCTISYDPFRFLALHNKVYGFAITVIDQINTIPSLIPTVLDYLEAKGIKPRDPHSWEFLMRKNGDDYAACHFWTNFEIGDLRFFRSREYQDLFRALDQAGGFYTERASCEILWGDAPVRALALGALAGIDKIHHFEDIGYQHDWFFQCPSRSTSLLGPLSTKEGESVAGCQCECPMAGDLQGREKGRELVDMNDDWRYSCMSFWKDAVRKSRGK